MVRNYKRKTGARRYLDYGGDTMQLAIDAVENGMSFKKASETYKVCRSTLMNRAKGKHNSSAGGQTVLLKEEEEEIVSRLLQCADYGFPTSIMDVRIFVKSFLDNEGRTIPKFTNNFPGQDWALAFLKRHKSVTRRTANNIKRARAEVSKESLEAFHQNMTEEIKIIRRPSWLK